ncbi:hypothetical protein F1880_000524 [Penicillium rolfsii]|nr:hypothetical protein F1880_000524 [Penicillium rolfsii]
MTSKCPLLIPHKRALLPSTTHTIYNQQNVYKMLNPSSTPAITHMKPPLGTNEDEEESTHEPTRGKSTRIECSFAAAPQPFLDPPTWEAMLKRAQSEAASAAASAGESASASASNNLGRRIENLSESSGTETPDQQRIRREREAEYGSMAIRAIHGFE